MSDSDKVRRRSKLWLIVILVPVFLIGAFAADVVWEVFVSHRYDPAGATTPDNVANYTSVPPPAEARDCRVAAFKYGQARLVFARFSAPVDVCRKYAAAVMPNTALKPLTQDQKYSDLMTIFAGTNQLSDMHWFDLPYGQKFWIMPSGNWVFRRPAIEEIPDAPDIVGADANTEREGYLITSVRVDVSRGVFYYLREN